MNRDELLTKLAMELEEWPENTNRMFYGSGDRLMRVTDPRVVTTDCAFSESEYLQRRTELINKPSWYDAPEWAEWLAQDGDHHDWWWHEEKPCVGRESFDSSGCYDLACDGKTPAGHDWRETLERRPSKRELNPTTSSLTDCQARGAALDTGLCSDGSPCGSPHNVDDDAYCVGCPNEPNAEEHTTTADAILAAARQHMLDRASTYDKPEGERSMGATVGAFKAVTGIELSEEQGWIFMQLLKAVRSQQGYYRADSYEDGAAYVALSGEAAARDRKNQ